MSKAYLLTEETSFGNVNRRVSTIYVGIVTSKEVAVKFGRMNIKNNYRPLELNDPELLNRIAKTETKPYKGAINQPCSACSEDPKMEFHDHDYVNLENRREE